MSKLDRQLDQVNSVTPLKIVWQAFDDVDTHVIVSQLREAIKKAEYRVTMDCREVDGAPQELVEILLDAHAFAKIRGKHISLTYATPELREALRPGVRKPVGKSIRDRQQDAATAAAESLHEKIEPPQSLNFQPLPPSKKTAKWLQSHGRILKLAAITLLLAGTVGAIEWYLVFHAEETFDIGQIVETKAPPPIKTFEGN